MTQDPYRNPPPPAPPPPPGGGAADDLQFDRAESAQPATPASIAGFGPPPAAAASACAVCNRPLTEWYFEAGGKIVCPECQQTIAASMTGGSGFARFFKATVYGIGAGLVGAAIWWAVRYYLNMQIGLIAILVGFMVGGAIRAGSSGRGGIGYQILAVVLTYLCIAANYVPDLIIEAMKPENAGEAPRWFLVAFAVVISLAVPFLRGAGGIIGLLIIGFALYQAWVLNKKQEVTFNGPYRVAPTGDAAGMAGTPAVAGYAAPPPPTPAGGYPPPPPPNQWPPPTGAA